MKSKLISIILVLAMVLGLMGCGVTETVNKVEEIITVDGVTKTLNNADEVKEQGYEGTSEGVLDYIDRLVNSTDDMISTDDIKFIENLFKVLGNSEGNEFTNGTTDEDNEFLRLDFKKIDITLNGETWNLEGIVYDKTEKKLIPIYSPENNFEEAIYTDFKHKADILTVLNRYPVSVDEAYCVFVESYGNSCMDFDGLRIDKSPFTDFDFIWMYLTRDFVSGTRYDVLQERWGIDDNYIKYKLEPSRIFGMPNQEEMDWSYTYFR